MSQIISRENLYKIVDELRAGGKIVGGPVQAGSTGRTRYFFKELDNEDSLVLDASIMPTNSIKEFFFPRHEMICRYHHEGKQLVVIDAEPFAGEQVIFGARPCDAASLPILDKVFSWDFQDRFYQQRRENSTVITLACQKADENCFCTSVGLSPDTTDGADAMLLEIDENTFEVRTFTDKGKAIFDGKTTESDRTGKTAEPPEIQFDAKKVEKYLSENYDDPIFDITGLRCVACGACTYLCPTCHCFDIVDEGGDAKGKRVKNWDSCQFTQFTHHASGHNPRGDQAARQRNRVQHKFRIYPGKFGMILCTGCGNCTRECSASLGIRPVLAAIGKKANG